MNLPNKKYSLIYCDPPWVYADKQNNRPGIVYDTMTPKEISNLNVKEISEKDSVIAMWATYPQMEVALEVMKNWGFEYKTVLFTWIKTYEKSGKLFWGMGRYTRSNPEVILLGKKGKGLKVENHGIHNVQYSGVLKHSEKPALFRNLLTDLFDLDKKEKIELFCRHNLEGWDTWGNEVGKLGESK